MDSNAAWGAVEEGGAVVEGGPGVAEMGTHTHAHLLWWRVLEMGGG